MVKKDYGILNIMVFLTFSLRINSRRISGRATTGNASAVRRLFNFFHHKEHLIRLQSPLSQTGPKI